jgi:hypothetical protein
MFAARLALVVLLVFVPTSFARRHSEFRKKPVDLDKIEKSWGVEEDDLPPAHNGFGRGAGGLPGGGTDGPGSNFQTDPVNPATGKPMTVEDLENMEAGGQFGDQAAARPDAGKCAACKEAMTHVGDHFGKLAQPSSSEVLVYLEEVCDEMEGWVSADALAWCRGVFPKRSQAVSGVVHLATNNLEEAVCTMTLSACGDDEFKALNERRDEEMKSYLAEKKSREEMVKRDEEQGEKARADRLAKAAMAEKEGEEKEEAELLQRQKKTKPKQPRMKATKAKKTKTRRSKKTTARVDTQAHLTRLSEQKDAALEAGKVERAGVLEAQIRDLASAMADEL